MRDHTSEDRSLGARKRGETRRQLAQLGTRGDSLRIDLQRALDDREHAGRACRLDDVVERALLHRVDARHDVIARRDEDDRRRRAALLQSAQQIHAAGPWHGDVEQATARRLALQPQ